MPRLLINPCYYIAVCCNPPQYFKYFLQFPAIFTVLDIIVGEAFYWDVSTFSITQTIAKRGSHYCLSQYIHMHGQLKIKSINFNNFKNTFSLRYLNLFVKTISSQSNHTIYLFIYYSIKKNHSSGVDTSMYNNIHMRLNDNMNVWIFI